MTIADFVKSLTQRKVELSLSEGQIRYRGPSDALGDEVLSQIRERKPALIEYLSHTNAPDASAVDPDALSLGQEALWFIYELDRDSLAYNTLYADRLRRDLDTGALRRALTALTVRHDVLRTRFGTRAGRPYRDVLTDPAVEFAVTDATGYTPAELEAAIEAEGDRPFELEAAPPVRWHLMTGAANGTLPTPVLIFVAHHTVVDFRSLEILLRDLSALYRAEVGEAPADLPDLPWTYAEYVARSREWVGSEPGIEARAFWLRELDGELPVLDLPTDRPRPPIQSFDGATLTRDLDGDLSAAVRTVAQRLGVTPYVLLLGTFGILLHRYSGQREILIGSPMLGRNRPELADLAGYFVNPVVLRLSVSEGLRTSDYLSGLRTRVLSALEHQDYPFPRLVDDLKPERDGSRSPIFQVAFVYERERGTPLGDQGLFTEMLAGGQRGAVFDITLTVLDRPDGLRLTWEYAAALFDGETMARMAGHFEHLLAQLLDQLQGGPDGTVGALSLLPEAEAARIGAWNRTDAPLPEARNLAELIARQVMRDPSAIALEDGERRLSYGALDIRACRLARHLQGLGVAPNDVVALALPRGAEQMIALLGVLRAGCACLPIDPNDPAERLSFLLAESGAKVVLTDPDGAARLPETVATVIELSPDAALLIQGCAEAPDCPAGLDDLVYLLFTSGSTGRPKGVAMPHRAMVNLMSWHATQPGLAQPARTLQYTALTFDVAFQEIVSTWCGGGTLVLIDEDRRRDGRALLDWIEDQAIERVFMPFVALQHLAECAAEHGLPTCLRDIITAGEQLRITPSIRAAFAGCSCRLHNHYGPTESHVVTAHTLPESPETWEELAPIGRPIANTRIHLLDGDGQPVPVGVPGELCVAGAALARGYLARPDLTAERFIEHAEHGRLYRTGDFARWRPDGLLAYLGRRDDQVKVRGIRVELGEIEAVLSAHPAVGQAAVVTHGAGAALQLAAFVAPSDGRASGDALRTELQAHLRSKLATPLVPGSLTLLPRLPQTSSGKIDRRALPQPALMAETAPTAPRSQDEALLTEIWGEVLGLPTIGIATSFFDLGGHSLIAMRLIARIREGFAVDLPLSALFEDPTVAGLTQRIADLRGGDTLPTLTHNPSNAPRTPSFAQRRLWLLDRLEGPSATYNMPATLSLKGPLDVAALRLAACRLVDRHQSLRSHFPYRAGEPQALLLAPYDPLAVTDLTAAEDCEAEAVRLAHAHAARPFDLAEGPLFRLHLLILSETEHRLLFNIHHIVSDRWSIDLLVRDFAALYRAGAAKGEADLPIPEVDFADYADWQADWLQGEALERQLTHWHAALDGAPTQLELPADRPHPATRSYTGGLWEHHLDPALTERLRAFNRATGATDFMSLLSVFGLLLARHSGQDDLLIGCPVSNRWHRACEDLVGMFVNTLALRWTSDEVPDFAGLVARMRQRSLTAHAHADLPFELLVDHLQPERQLARSPLFQVMFVMQNAALERLTFGATEALLLPPPITVSKFDLTLYVEPCDDGLTTRWEYNADIFDEARIARLSAHFEQLLRQALAAPQQPLAELRLVTEDERRRLDIWGQGPAVNLPWDTLVAGFEAQVTRSPDATALVGDGETLDYATVNRRANQLAHCLGSHGVAKGALVGVCLAPGPQAVVALLAIAKAGAAYLPLDPTYPAERLAHMLSESGASLVLTTTDLCDRLPDIAPILKLDSIAADLAARPTANPASRADPDDLLYVIYTSGSTGRPKGAGVRHGGFANLLNWYCRTLELGAADRGLLVSALGFDLTQKNLFAPLLCGASLYFPSTGIGYDPTALRAAIAEHAITWVNCTPSAFYPIVEGSRKADPADLASLRHVVLGGEPIRKDRLASWLDDPSCRATVLNSYGPTECTDVAVAGPLDHATETSDVPLGRPIDNVRLLVVDPADTPLPPGLAGELLIGGAGIGTGYSGRDDLTAQQFVALTVNGRTARFYRTGDRVAWRDDGSLDYLGRRDAQVKLRGFRIELGEIETLLRAQPGVEDAAVVVRRAGASEHLIAYLVGDEIQDPDDLRPALLRQLPGYMVPTSLVRLDALPLTPNSKLDRQALAALAVAPQPGEAPVGETELRLAEIWKTLLGLEAADRGASFFSVGGHSLLAVQLVARISDSFGIELSLRSLFETPTLAGLAAKLDAADPTGLPSLAALPQKGLTQKDLPQKETAEPSFAQQRLMFLDQLEGPNAAYSMPGALELTGDLDVAALRTALTDLVARHESLRLCFAFDDGHPVVHRLAPYDPLTEEDLSTLPETAALKEAEQLAERAAALPFDLATGPLFRIRLLKIGPQRHRLLVNLHHIIADGWSIDLLICDLSRLYAAARRGENADLPTLDLHYTDYAAWQRRRLQSDALDRQLAFWRDRLGDAPELTDLPTDHPRGAVQQHEGRAVPLHLDRTLTEGLRALARGHDTTLFTVLMAGFKLLLSRYSGVRDLCVGVPVANRIDSRLERVVGLFLNTVVVRSQIPPTGTLAALITAERAATLAAFAHQDMPFESLVEALRPTRSLSHNPLFQVMLNLVGTRRAEIDLDGLTVTRLTPERDDLIKFDLNLTLTEAADGSLDGALHYNAALFEEETIAFLGDGLSALLRRATARPDAPLSELSALPEILPPARAMPVPPGKPVRFGSIERSVPACFAARVARHRNRTAIRTPEGAMTYGDLDTAARTLATVLLARPDSPRVALLVPHDARMAVAMLGCLQAGRCYVPLAPSQPPARLRALLDDVETDLIVAAGPHLDLAADLTMPDLTMPDRTILDLDAIDQAPAEHLPEVSPDATAYILYTSGSTGRPKGVAQNHRNILHFIRRYAENLRLRPEDRLLQVASYAFDAAVMDIYSALLTGASLYPVDLRRTGLAEAAEWMAREDITVLHATPSVFRALTAEIDRSHRDLRLPAVRLVVLGGEVVNRDDLAAFRARFEPGCLFVNGLGPTESTVTLQLVAGQGCIFPRFAVPVGYPVKGTGIDLLDETGAPAELFGEIAIASPYVAHGYWRQDSDAFTVDTRRPGTMLYRSGDLARRLPDGSLEVVGRRDHQVKLRGFRIELGEIEAVLRAHPDIRQAAALLHAPQGRPDSGRLVVYLTGTATPQDALAWCSARLPGYMVPSQAIPLADLPLTITGKLDRAALPEPVDVTLPAGDDRPATPSQELLAGLWAEVLGVDTVGRSSDFFDLGGHSLLATQLVSRIRQTFSADIPLRLLFEHPVLADQAAALDTARRGTDIAPPPPILPREDRSQLPLSFAQQRLWFLAQLDDGQSGGAAAAYNVTAALHVDGALDEPALRAALTALTERHESLRMSLRNEAGQPTMSLRDPFDPLAVEDLSGLASEERDAAMQTRAADHAAQPFDLQHDPLLRLTLLRLGSAEQVLLVNLHHIAADGWSLGVLVRDLGALYAQALGQGPGLAPPSLHYADYAAWQRDWLDGAVLEHQTAYWRDRLDGAPGLLELPADRPRPAVKTGRGAQLAVTLDPALVDRLAALGRARGATLFMTLLAAFHTLLHRYTGESDILVGSPIANRTQRQSEDLVGFFVNTLVLRARVERDRPFADLLAQLRDTALDAYAHQDLPFETLVTELQPQRALSHSPLFQVMFGLQNAPTEALSLGDLSVTTLAPQTRTAKFDLTVSAEAGPAGLTVNWEYSTDLFERSRIERMARHYVRLLQAVVGTPDEAVGRLPLLDGDEVARIASWSGGESPYPREAGLADLFAEQVAANPDAVALHHGTTTVSYGDLNARSDRLAAYLTQRAGDLLEGVIGLCLERGPDLVVAMLAAIKSGAAYLPLDPELPAERRRYMLDDADAALVVGEESLANELDDLACPVVLLDRDAEAIAACTDPVPALAADGSALAYVMYTSGSTGRPKGVLIPQRAVTRLVRDTDYVDIRPASRIGQAANTAFDAATFEIWGALLNGAALVLLSRDQVLDPDHLAALLRAETVDTLFLTTALFNRLAQIDPGVFNALETLLFGGEAVDPRWVRAVLDAGGPKHLLHVYGPTECTTFATWHRVTAVPHNAATVPIGRPIANTTAHILDPDGQPVPLGVAGELHLGGDGLADGYLGQPALTAERFIEHPSLGRLYCTGDLCRRDEDGTIAYLGRSDHQIKMRGFRIELGEVETALRRCTGVEDAVVLLVGTDAHRRLAAYVAGKTLDAEAIRAELRRELPDYMVPAHLIVLDTLPLNPNGKLDRAALPEPQVPVADDGTAPPRTPREVELAAIWQAVLGRHRIGRDENFFELGGDSILSIQIVAQARKSGLRIGVHDLFQHQSIAALAPHVTTSDLQPPAAEADADASGPVGLSPIQAWFFEWDLAEPGHFNQALLLRPRARLTPEILETACRAILARHGALRLRFERGPDGWRQSVADTPQEVPVHVEDLRALPEPEQEDALTDRASRWQCSLDLARGPLTRLVLFELSRGQRLLWCIHHLAVDGVSWRILLADLDDACTQALAGEAPLLAPPTAGVPDWVRYLQRRATGPDLETEIAYWRGWPQMPALPKNDPDAPAGWDSTAHAGFALSRDRTTDLLERAPAAFNTRINDLLLTALALALGAWTGRSDWPIALESHGRPTDPDAPDLTATVGWFTALYPIRLELPEATDPAACLKAVKEQLRAVPGDGLAYGIVRHLRDDTEPLPEAEIAFNYLGQVEAGSGGGGLFDAAAEGTGESQCLDGTRPHTLDVNALVSGGALHVSISYSDRQYRRATVERLATALEAALLLLIDLCCDPQTCGYTPGDFPLARLDQDRCDALARREGRGIAALYPLSPMQQGMAYHSQLEGASDAAYYEQMTWRIGAPFDPRAFRHAWQALVARHPVLRTALWLDSDPPLQVVRRSVTLPWREVDWLGRSDTEQKAALEKLLAADRRDGIDLSRAPLLRCSLIRLSARSWRFVLGFHHLLLDGWSLPILFAELMRLYGEPAAELPPAVPYERYIAWLDRQDPEAARTYWRDRVGDVASPTPLPLARSPSGSAARGELLFALDAEDSRLLTEAARRQRLTLSTLVQAAWALVLARTGGEDDVVFGVTLSGRDIDLAGVADMVGLFINTVPLRVSVADTPIAPWLQALQDRHQENSLHGYLPLAEIQRETALPAGSSLFDSLLVFENYPTEPAEAATSEGGPSFADGQAIDHTNYPLTVIAAVADDTLRLRVGYDATRFTPRAVERLVGFLRVALRRLAEAEPDTSLDAIGILSRSERQALLDAGRAQGRLPIEDTLLSRFAAQARAAPDRVAVTCGVEQLSYGELDARAEVIGRRLRALGAGPERIVGLYMNRSIDLIVGLLGILKAGAAYLPIDPATPVERAGFMLRDAGAVALVTEKALVAETGLEPVLPDLPRLNLDDARPSEVAPEGPLPEVSSETLTPDTLAYVIYTSGSTGTPKGVMVSHANVLRLFDATAPECGFGPQDVWTLFHSAAFDFSVWEIWGALLHGGRLVVVPPQTQRDPAVFHDLLAREGVTVLNQTPSAFRQLIPVARERGASLALRLVICGGEALDLPALRPWFALYGEATPLLVNMYGITETTVHVTWRPLGMADCDTSASLIGAPLRDLDLHLLDRRGEPVPEGVTGEIHVGGAGLARGYLNRPALTAERFVMREIGGAPVRLYRSGDLARRRPDGDMEYLGRADNQVKLRGYRIETGEIEATLSRHPAVEQAVVVAQQAQGRLIAYVVGDAETATGLREWLAPRLPGYMVPAVFIALDAIPLTRNGKLDRHALPEPDTASPVRGGIAPRTETERQFADIWRDVLAVDTVGVEDGFFDLGGHSLKAVQVVARIRARFGVDLPLAAFLNSPTIAALVPLVAGGSTVHSPIEARPAQEDYPLSHAQRRLWLEDRLHDDARYNMPAAFELADEIDADALRLALDRLIARHEPLRTVFVEVDGEPRQKILDRTEAPLKILDTAQDTARDIEATVARESLHRFALDQAPLFRLTLIRRTDAATVVILVMHHIIGDGWSMQVFHRELTELYAAARTGRAANLPPLTIQYRDYALAQERRDRADDARFWAAQLDGLAGPIPLPRDATDGAGGDRRSVTLAPSCTGRLRALASRHGTTIAALMLALFILFLHRLTRQTDLCIGMAAANRGRPEVEPLLGVFVNLLPIRMTIDDDMAFVDLLSRVTGTTYAALDHQDHPYDLILRDHEQRSGGRGLVNVVYAYQSVSGTHSNGEDATTRATAISPAFPFAKFDLSLIVEESGPQIGLTLEFDAGLFTAATAERYLQTLNRFAEGVAGDPNQEDTDETVQVHPA